MAIAPIPVLPAAPSARGEPGRARLVAVLAAIGIAAALVAYAASPAVRHAVGHAAHSVRGAVGHVLDRDAAKQHAGAAGAAARPGARRQGAARLDAGATTSTGGAATKGRGATTLAGSSR
jgi:hypothetical protein